MKIEIFENYKTLVELYYKGFEFQVGENAPKLAKQLEKQGIKHTPDELQAWGDLKNTLFDEDLNEKLDIILTDNLPDYDEQDKWAFNGSCHCQGGEGQYTSEILAQLDEARYCYIWAEDGTAIGRFYYLENSQELGVADLYCEAGHGIYTVPRLLLAIAYSRKYADFVKIDRPLVESPYGNNNGYWSNLTAEGYTHYTTSENWKTLYISPDDFDKVLENNGLYWSQNCGEFIDEDGDDYIYCDNIKDYEYITLAGTCDYCCDIFSTNGDFVEDTRGCTYCCESCAIQEGCLEYDYIWYNKMDVSTCENCGDYVFDDFPFCSEECEEEYNENVA